MSSDKSTANLDQTMLAHTELKDLKKLESSTHQILSEFDDTLQHDGQIENLQRNRQSRTNELSELEDRYKIEGLLGVGGFASVHKAHDQKVGRKLALKSLESSYDDMMVMSFNLEARVMSQLDHPGILPVYDLIERSETEPFHADKEISKKMVTAYSMRIASHASLYEYLLETATLDIHKLCQDLQRVALTLEYAHQRGVLHRDIKPHNILLGNEGEVYLTDWGVCLLLPHHQVHK